MTATALRQRPSAGLHHEALSYRGREDFLAATTDFVRSGARTGEEVLVVVSQDKIDALRDVLGRDADPVVFFDMRDVGRNPARVTALWRWFVDRNAGHVLRGVGEPVWPDRTPDELVECAAHESLLNVALADADLWLVCPYDVEALQDRAVRVAFDTHPHTVTGATRDGSPAYRQPGREVLAVPLSEPQGAAAQLAFEESLRPVRRMVAEHAAVAGLSRERTDDLLLAVNEAASNSLRHGGGRGSLRVWRDNGRLVCEVRDGGRISHPLAGRIPPRSEALDGRGLWMINRLCDLVQLRSFTDGTVVRLHMSVQ